MSHPTDSDLLRRLKKVPGQLLLALVNGSAILVILAALLAIIGTTKVTHLAQTVASTMTDTVLSRVDEDPRELVQSVQRLSEDVHTLTIKLADGKTEGLSSEISRLDERLDSLETSLEQLSGVRSELVDELVAKAGTAMGDALQKLRACRHREEE